MKKFKTLDLVYIAVCAALMAICAWISIPTAWGVSFTLQTFAVFFALFLLGGKKGTLAILVYILLGLVGVPVFSGFKATAALAGPTGGYIVGFLLSGLLMWLVEVLLTKVMPEKPFGNAVLSRKVLIQIIGAILGLAICYAFGTAWFMILYGQSNGAISLGTALGWCVIPYIPFDIAKIALAFGLSKPLAKVVRIEA